ncbi:methyltransferase domain-containing protein [Sphingomonas daechungensis]|uniref:methyltransferase domain-containing protein n=1 Tax=Sphingomonas daechungensis TaxID=1176646 RepID=UPI0031E5A888
MSTRAIFALILVTAAGACRQASQQPQFPNAHREVAPIVNDSFSTEDARDRVGEAEQVISLAGIQAGMSVADIGAGEGYYTVRLAPVVGPKGRVLAEDIVPDVEDRLAQRVHRENLDNVAVKLGEPDDPMLPSKSFDRIFMVHMYHEVQSPYAFLWHMREALKPDGQVIVVDANRPTKRHGIEPRLLECEFAAVGLKLVNTVPISEGENYFAAFRIAAPRPAPDQIKACAS